MTLEMRATFPRTVQPNLCGMMEPNSPAPTIASRQVVNLALTRRPFVSKRATRRRTRTRLRSLVAAHSNCVDSVIESIVPLTILGV